MRRLFEALSDDAQTVLLWFAGEQDALHDELGDGNPVIFRMEEAMRYHVLPTWARVQVAFAELESAGWIRRCPDPTYYTLS